MRYNKLIYITLVLVTVLWACDSDEDFNTEFSDIRWFTSLEKNEVFNVEEGRFITFLDLSQNPLSHEWQIDSNAAFLRDDFSITDSVLTDDIAGTELVTSAANISVLFMEPGLAEVRLFNTFEDSVAWFDPQADIIDTLFSEFVDGVWVIDTTFTVDVYRKLNPVFKVFRNDVEILSIDSADMPSLADTASWPTVEVPVGGSLRFEDLREIGRPNQTNWILDDGSDAPNILFDPSAEFIYTKLGENLAGTLASIRKGGDLPEDSVAKLIPLKIKGVPSSEPFVQLGDIVELESEKLVLEVTGEMNGFIGKEGSFTVHVKNGDFDSNIAVTTAAVSLDNATQIELTLADPIYNSDTIDVSYNEAGDIKSKDFRTLSSFSNVPVIAHFGDNVITGDWAGYETAGGNTKAALASGFWIGNGNVRADNTLFYERVEELSFEGVASMKYSTGPDGINSNTITMQGSAFGAQGPIPAGSYVYSCMVYLETSSTLETLSYLVNKYEGDFIRVDFDLSSIAKGEWVKVSTVVNFSIDVLGDDRWDHRIDAGLNPTDAIDQVLYIDSQSFIPFELRPE